MKYVPKRNIKLKFIVSAYIKNICAKEKNWPKKKTQNKTTFNEYLIAKVMKKYSCYWQLFISQISPLFTKVKIRKF
jgi:hypothetical protein